METGSNKGFLEIVAERILEKFGTGFSDYIFVLPGKRAYMLLKEKISKRIDFACWEPECKTLTQLLSEVSGLKQADDIVLLSKLFCICQKILGTEFFSDDFDSFVSWGEILLSDFSGIDNNVVDASKLFSNVSDLIEIDNKFSDSNIDSAIETTLRPHTVPKEAKYHKEFNKIWDKLYDIYTLYREELLKEGIGYQGMISRKAAENAGKCSGKYIFIGFNTFNEAEYRFAKGIDIEAIYWDSCHFFDLEDVNMKLNPDGMAYSTRKIGCPTEEVIPSPKQRQRSIEIVRCPTDIMQCKAVMTRLEKIEKIGYETAIVLADDTLLPIMLQSVPPCIDNVNITTGLPVWDSSAYIFYKVLESIIINQKNGLYRRNDILYLLTDTTFSSLWNRDEQLEELKQKITESLMPYFSIEDIDNSSFRKFFPDSRDAGFNIGEFLMESLSCFSKISGKDDITEIVLRMNRCIHALSVALSRHGIVLSSRLFLRMLGRSLSRSYTPYETEAMEGLQITGILETRCQDFKNVFILSASDDILPKGSQLLSFIPMNLREAYNLPRSGDFQRMSASYFYHLLLRAENICILYNGNATQNRTGEPSRFIRQLEYLTPKGTQISYTSVISRLHTEDQAEYNLRHSEDTQKELSKATVSASMICCYLNCKRRFALQYYYKLRPKSTPNDDFKASDYGTAVHNSLENICKPNIYCKAEAQRLLSSFETKVMPVIENVGYRYMHDNYPHKVGTAEMKRIEEMIRIWIKRVLHYDSTHEEFRTLAVEKVCDKTMIQLSDGRELKTVMKIDRLDIMGDRYRVVDYKCGKKETLKLDDIDDLFEEGKPRENRDPVLQTMFYGLNFENEKWIPAIYSLPKLESEDFSPYPKGCDMTINQTDIDKYKTRLKELLEDILDSNTEKEFTPCLEGSMVCSFCDYKSFCGR